MRIGVYYRVSTDKQTFSSQRAVVEDWVTKRYPGAEVIRYQEKVSGKSLDRSEHKRMMADAESKYIQAVVVYKLDRFSRSMWDAMDAIRKLDEWKCAFHSVTQQALDTSEDNPFRNMMISLFGTLAQMEREMLVTRIKDGQAASDKRPGRRQSIPNELRDEIRSQYSSGKSIRQIERDLGVSKSRVQVIIKEGI